jgi:hypothetical protein
VLCFQRCLELDPSDQRALGNLGNALLAQGELKKALAEELQVGPPPRTSTEQQALAATLERLRWVAVVVVGGGG